MTHVLSKILISKRSINPVNIPRSAYKNLSKSRQSVSRKSLSKSAPSMTKVESQAEKDTKKKLIQPSVGNVLLYILSSFDEGYCMLNDSGLLSLFHESSEEKIIEWCQLQEIYFGLNHSINKSVKIYPCFVDVEPCSFL